MPLQNLRRLVLAGIENTYGVDPTLTGSNAVKLGRDLEFRPLDADGVPLDYMQGFMGSNAMLMAGQRVSLNCSVDLASSGTAGTAPAWSSMARACGLSELITAGTSVVYKPASANFDAATLYYFLDGQRQIATGCRGNMTLRAAAKGLLRMAFNFQGLYNAPSTTANPTPNFSAYQDPSPLTKEFVQTMTLQGVAAKVYDFEIDIGQQVSIDETMSSREVVIGGRETRGTITLQLPTLAQKDWHASILANTKGAFALQVNTAGGKIVQVDAPAVQVMNPQYGDSNGIATVRFDLNFVPSSGNDELSITVR